MVHTFARLACVAEDEENGIESVRQMWSRLRDRLGMRDPIPHYGSVELPALAPLVRSGPATGCQLLAACQGTGPRPAQAFAYARHDVICVTVVLFPAPNVSWRENALPSGGSGDALSRTCRPRYRLRLPRARQPTRRARHRRYEPTPRLGAFTGGIAGRDMATHLRRLPNPALRPSWVGAIRVGGRRRGTRRTGGRLRRLDLARPPHRGPSPVHPLSGGSSTPTPPGFSAPRTPTELPRSGLRRARPRSEQDPSSRLAVQEGKRVARPTLRSASGGTGTRRVAMMRMSVTVTPPPGHT
ncbi:CATRA conflict system CASPASE/TPR repeat-associated protein [Streptomyces olivaceoviridis]